MRDHLLDCPRWKSSAGQVSRLYDARGSSLRLEPAATTLLPPQLAGTFVVVDAESRLVASRRTARPCAVPSTPASSAPGSAATLPPSVQAASAEGDAASCVYPALF